MEIDKLYEELGRELARWQMFTQLDRDEYKEYQARQKLIKDKLKASETRLKELNEAVKLAQDGMDPLLAKITAKENLEERLQQISTSNLFSRFLEPRREFPDLTTKEESEGGDASPGAGC